MKIFISHKQEDSNAANQIAIELKNLNVEYYLDILDSSIEQGGKELTNHIKKNLNDCTDIIVIMSQITKASQWVPFEIGMAAQKDMPTATFLHADVALPDFLDYWPRLKTPQDIRKYVAVKNRFKQQVALEKALEGRRYQNINNNISDTQRFYDELKKNLQMN